jgi:uncharacterized protein YqjF (DUF2071 family)
VTSDFDFGILERTSHRPWPLPGGPWIMRQTWTDLLFAHWPVDGRLLQATMPPGMTVDRYDGQAWLGIVPFQMSNVAPRGVPNLPFVSAFAELNVRTYVTLGGKPGVYFFSLDADSQVAVTAARTLFRLPYFVAAMAMQKTGDRVRCRSRRAIAGPGVDPRSGAPVVAELEAHYRPTGPVRAAEPGTLEYFLTERYCLYNVDGAYRARRLEIHHPPWPLQPAEADITVNTMAAAAGITLPATPPLLHFAVRQDTVAWPLCQV